MELSKALHHRAHLYPTSKYLIHSFRSREARRPSWPLWWEKTAAHPPSVTAAGLQVVPFPAADPDGPSHP